VSTTTATFPPQVATQISEAIAHVNDEHPDTVLLLARHVAVLPEATAAEIDAADPLGVDLRLVVDDTTVEARLTFAEEVNGAEQLQAQVYVAILEARAAVGDSQPLTSLESDFAKAASVPTHPARILSVDRLTPAILEVRLGGLTQFEPLGPDTFLLAMVDTGPDHIGDDYQLADYQAQAATGAEGPVRVAYYTLRHWDPETSELTIWVVLHEDTSGVAGWMLEAQPGDPVVFWGPREAFEPQPDTDAFLMVADETGLAAVAVIVEQMPADAIAVAVLEVGDMADVPPMPDHPGLTVHWLVRGDREPGVDSEIVATVEQLDLDLKGHRWSAFGGAESRVVTRVRNLVRHEWGLPAERVSMLGYWRRQQA
jgi:NADPH-dependent ferric siderophore reductase